MARRCKARVNILSCSSTRRVDVKSYTLDSTLLIPLGSDDNQHRRMVLPRSLIDFDSLRKCYAAARAVSLRLGS